LTENGEEHPARAGWFGKLPALGDFASRRLPHAFTEQWDPWLASGMEASRAVLGAGWLDAFLHAPVWNFALAPGIIDAQYWFGVMIPSVDRVGRYFPLTIVAPLGTPDSPASILAIQHWLGGLRDAALAALEEGHTVEALEAALADLPVPATAAETAAAIHGDAPWPLAMEGFAQTLACAALARLWQDCSGMSMWWSEGGAAIQLHVRLPPASAFHALLADPGSA
jgi:type VI secretion system protein ImpM